MKDSLRVISELRKENKQLRQQLRDGGQIPGTDLDSKELDLLRQEN